MASSRDVLLLGAESPAMRQLRIRLSTLGYRGVPAKTPEQAQLVLQMARGAIRAAVLPPDLPVVDLGRTIRFLTGIAGQLWFLAAGPPPAREERARLRDAGVSYALFDPLHDHDLRFQLNRAFARSSIVRGRRRTLRAPTRWNVPVWTPAGRREAGLYTVSASGAFLATPTPSLRGTVLRVALPLPGSTIELAARVVSTNVAGNLAQKILPSGMAVAFEGTSEDAEARLHLYAQERLNALAV
ncbi:MAG TPA: PilZ domain-containing protein [Myxococcota bacterium]|jgi:hypothetical protein|nr:PilZ domain-containing protein [Myxococcota bacterium]